MKKMSKSKHLLVGIIILSRSAAAVQSVREHWLYHDERGQTRGKEYKQKRSEYT